MGVTTAGGWFISREMVGIRTRGSESSGPLDTDVMVGDNLDEELMVDREVIPIEVEQDGRFLLFDDELVCEHSRGQMPSNFSMSQTTPNFSTFLNTADTFKVQKQLNRDPSMIHRRRSSPSLDSVLETIITLHLPPNSPLFVFPT